MKKLVAMAVILGALGGCAKQSSPTMTEVVMAPVEVGTKTPDYEVVGPNELRLASGVKIQVVEGAGGQNNGFVLLKQNGGIGGFMACGCIGATTSSCKTENDNPEHASCSGSCTDSEGNAHPCQLEGPIIGPPKDPFHIKFVAKSTSN
ncbi:MAG: hypothetical protein HY272_04360 [Gammaproteobacteria bacterium]|nr:hypothetical protein [Gammaproteobacteria bacterium]